MEAGLMEIVQSLNRSWICDTNMSGYHRKQYNKALSASMFLPYTITEKNHFLFLWIFIVSILYC